MALAKFDIKTDVVVIGYGSAGAVAAITAHDNGADVIILEKMPQGGGNSRVCGGNIIMPQSKEFAKYLNTLTFKMTDAAIIDRFVESAMSHGDWIRGLGGEFTVYSPLQVSYPMAVAGPSFPQVPGAEYMVKYNIKGKPEIPPAQRLWDLLSSNVERRGIKVMLNTPAKELVKDSNGEIIGVLAESEGKTVTISAKRAVILTCGGFENDKALKWDNLPCKPILFAGNPGNTGDGIRMAQKVGAALWHMTGLSCVMGFKAPEYEAVIGIMFLSPAYIFVDKYGKRFIGETEIETHEFWRSLSYLDTDHVEYPRIPFYAIFDEQVTRAGPLNSGKSGYVARDLYKWSADNSEEIKKGWIIQAKSIAELASKISIDKSNLEDTIKKYNEGCKTGIDAEFGRAKENLQSIKGSPYYAIKLYPALLNTQGGPRRDIESRVLDPDGKPIPRLYAAGELGSIWGFLYQGANNIGECIVFGRIAGKNAAAEKPHS